MHTKTWTVAVVLLGGWANVASGQGHLLTTPAGDGNVNVRVDGYGSFGSATDGETGAANFDPAGALTAASTVFDSGVAFRLSSTSGTRSFLSTGDIGGSGNLANPLVTGTTTTATSTFTFGGVYTVTLTQTLTNLMSGPTRIGATLSQSYAITNTSATQQSLDLARYIDGDLTFESGLGSDGGGRLFAANGRELLFETDTAANTATATTFVGIDGVGGNTLTTNRYEADTFSGLRTRVLSGVALDNTISGDGADADEFIDAGSGYDVTLALRNAFTLAAGGQVVYVTNTYFGGGPPADVPVPEPAGLLALGVGVLALARTARRRWCRAG